MQQYPPSKDEANKMGLRDELAIDRTLLANERTLLAYLRSGVALLIAGVTIMHFSSERWFLIVGLACLPTGMIAAAIGAARYRTMNNKIRILREHFKSNKESVL